MFSFNTGTAVGCWESEQKRSSAVMLLKSFSSFVSLFTAPSYFPSSAPMSRQARSHCMCSAQSNADSLLQPSLVTLPRKRRGATCEVVLGQDVLKALDQLRRTPPTTKNTVAPVPDSVAKRRRQAICSETANMHLILPSKQKMQAVLKPSIDFDTLLLEKAELVSLCCEMFECLGLTNKFKVSQEDLRRFVVQVIVPCLVVLCLALSCLALSSLVLSCLALPCLVQSCLVMSCLVFPYLALPHTR